MIHSSPMPQTNPSFEAPKKPLYFPNLNGVRFIAAFAVVVHHIEQAKQALGLPNIYKNYIVNQAGKQGVGLFFVLSGFLITYLLLSEKGKKGEINIKNFYMRRVLRIWPIYFVIVIAAMLVFPQISFLYPPEGLQRFMDSNFWRRLSLLLVVLPNLSFVFYELPYMCSQTWSIGVEEQFYYLWPWLVRANTWTNRLGIIAIFCAGTALVFAIYFHFFTDYTLAELPRYINFFFSQFRILMMVMGGIGAYLVYVKHPILQFLYRKDVQYVIYAVLLAIIFTGIHFTGIYLEVLSVFFCFFIVNVGTNPNTIIHLEQPIVSYLGKISYGIYIYHIAISILVANVLNTYQAELSVLQYNLIMYSLTIGLTVAVSSASFHFFEQKILSFKTKFSH